MQPSCSSILSRPFHIAVIAAVIPCATDRKDDSNRNVLAIRFFGNNNGAEFVFLLEELWILEAFKELHVDKDVFSVAFQPSYHFIPEAVQKPKIRCQAQFVFILDDFCNRDRRDVFDFIKAENYRCNRENIGFVPIRRNKDGFFINVESANTPPMQKFIDDFFLCFRKVHMYFLSNPACTADAATVFIAQMVNFHQVNHGLMLDDPELTNPFVLVNESVLDSVSREVPFIAIPLVGFINDADAVCKDDAQLLEGAASWSNKGFIALWKLHCNAQRDQLELTAVNHDIFSSTKINPVTNVEPLNLLDVSQIANLDSFHEPMYSFQIM
nr:MAG TPA: hypothetical protein [Caudoviricetes sp.]